MQYKYYYLQLYRKRRSIPDKIVFQKIILEEVLLERKVVRYEYIKVLYRTQVHY